MIGQEVECYLFLNAFLENKVFTVNLNTVDTYLYSLEAGSNASSE